MIKASFDENSSYVISGSEDGYIYIWPKYNDISNKQEDIKNNSYEYFCPDEKEGLVASCSFFLNEFDLLNYQKKFFFLSDILIKNVIVNCSNEGVIKVFTNVLFLED